MKKNEGFAVYTEIPEVLNRYGLDRREFMHEEQFPLPEQSSPDLCTDRLDYNLRDLECMKLAEGVEILCVLKSLEVVKGSDFENYLNAKRWLAYTYSEADRASWSNFREVDRAQLTAKAS